MLKSTLKWGKPTYALLARSFSSKPQLFDRSTVICHRDHVAKREDRTVYSYLRNDCIEQLCDRLLDIKRQFPVAVDLGCWDGELASVIRDRGGVKTLYECDSSFPMLQLARSRYQKEKNSFLQTNYIQVNEEFLPFRNNSVNIVFSPLYLHWTNDILRCFREVYRVLIPDGYFTGVMFSSKTLHELRDVMETAEMRTENVMSPHVSPLPTPGSIGDALVEAGFIITNVNAQPVTVEYRDMYHLMHHLQGMGENNALTERRRFVSRRTFEEAARLYKEKYPSPNGGVNATFELAFFSGWTVCPETAVVRYPKKPGVSLQDFFNSIPDDVGGKCIVCKQTLDRLLLILRGGKVGMSRQS